MSYRFYILGAGPVAAYCYEACREANPDADISIWTDGKSKPPQGAFWFHWIPEWMQEKIPVSEILVMGDGSAETYVKKQWGDEVDVTGLSSSFPREPYLAKGYNPARVWPKMFKNADIVYGHEFDDDFINEMAKECDILFLTFPTQDSKQALSRYLVPTPVVTYPLYGHYANTVQYVGTDSNIVRISKLFGKLYIEYRSNAILNQLAVKNGHVTQFMDIHPNCPVVKDDPDNNIRRIGRYATYDRHTLSHEAYARTMEILNG